MISSAGFTRNTDYPILDSTRTIRSSPKIRAMKYSCASNPSNFRFRFSYPNWLFPESCTGDESSDFCTTLNPGYYISSALHAYNAVTRTLKANGWTQTRDKNRASLLWIKPKGEDLPRFGKGNHFPGSGILGNKAKLAKSLRRMEAIFPNCYQNVIPETFVMPEDKQVFKENCLDHPLWIYKPSNGSCGSGILLFREFEELPDGDASAVVSRYIMNPLLIDGLKFDIRIYVLVTSYAPLRIYLFDDGIVRFATEPFDTDEKFLNCLNMHLSNFSLNKKSENYSVDKEECIKGCSGSKWSLKGLLDLLEKSFESKHENVRERVLKKIEDLVIRAIFASEQDIASKSGSTISFFELYGFDILLDADLNAWLLEVNIYPSLSSSSKLDKVIKTTLVTDMLNLACVPFGFSEKHIVDTCFEEKSNSEILQQPQDISNLIYECISDCKSNYRELYSACTVQNYAKLEHFCIYLIDEVIFGRFIQFFI
jgi:hypothetical protein